MMLKDLPSIGRTMRCGTPIAHTFAWLREEV